MKRKALLMAAGIAVPALVGVPLIAAAGLDCPSIEALRNHRPPESTQVFARDSSRIASLSPQRRTVVEITKVPALVRDGYVAVEDRRFWKHGGVDLRGVARAVFRDVTTLSFREGFSTIPMQLARNVFPDELPRAKKVGRKLCEIKLAGQMERQMSKRQILELYLNQIYLGDGLYGVEAASQGYFGKSIARVSPAEAALLVGLVQSPERMNPRKQPARALARRNVVLDVMVREGVIARATADQAKAEPLRLAPPVEAAGPAPYVVAAVRTELRARFGPDADVQGLRVYTGIDPALQRSAREALVAQIERIEAGQFGRYRHAKLTDAVRTVAADSATDATTPYLQGMVIALDPRNGEVRALVGGRDWTLSQFDRAQLARRQPGSAFKPLVYAAAIQAGLPVSRRLELSPIQDGGWRPGDHVSTSIESMSLRDALAKSSNTAAVMVGQYAGIDRVISLSKSLGLTTPIPAYPSIFLGAAEVVPAELVAAYATFGNGGRLVRPQLITRVENVAGEVLWRAENPRRKVLDEGVAYLTLSLMQEAVDHGTGAGVRRAGFQQPAAGKTGTTNDAKDVWFIGMTPGLVAGVWLGFDQPRQILPNASGGGLAAPVWGKFMAEYTKANGGSGGWTPPPAALVTARIDVASGHRATANCPPEQVHTEHFLPGTEPADHCPLHPESGVQRLFERLWNGIRRRG